MVNNCSARSRLTPNFRAPRAVAELLLIEQQNCLANSQLTHFGAVEIGPSSYSELIKANRTKKRRSLIRKRAWLSRWALMRACYYWHPPESARCRTVRLVLLR